MDLFSRISSVASFGPDDSEARSETKSRLHLASSSQPSMSRPLLLINGVSDPSSSWPHLVAFDALMPLRLVDKGALITLSALSGSTTWWCTPPPLQQG